MKNSILHVTLLLQFHYFRVAAKKNTNPMAPTPWNRCPRPHYITIFMGNRESNSSLIKICKLSKQYLQHWHHSNTDIDLLYWYCIDRFQTSTTFSLRPPKTASWSLSLIFLSVCHTLVPEDFWGSYTWSRGLKIFCTFFKPRIIHAIMGYFSSKTMLI